MSLSRVRRRSSRRSLGFIGLVLIAIFVVAALFPRLLAPYDPYAYVAMPFTKPSGAHLLGTNDIGQDILSELIWGSRVSVTVGIAVGMLSVLGGLLVGVLAGYLGGVIDTLLMRLVDVILVIPFLPLMILLSSVISPKLGTLILVLSITSWAVPARIIRSQTLSTRQEAYVEAARALGAGDGRIMLRHVLPSMGPLGLAQFVSAVCAAILSEAALSFLGLGDPTVKSWGTMLQFAQARGAFLTGSWVWWVIPPGLCIATVTVSFALVGFALEEWLDPRLRGR